MKTPQEIARVNCPHSEAFHALHKDRCPNCSQMIRAIQADREQRDRLHAAELERFKGEWPMKIFSHKHLDPMCVEKGCQSLYVEHLRKQQKALVEALTNLINNCDAEADPYSIKDTRAVLALVEQSQEKAE